MTFSADQLKVIIPTGTSLFSYLLGKASKSGNDRAQISALRKEVDQLKQARIDQGATLAAHTAMHEGYVRTLAAMSATLEKLGRDVAYIKGRIDSQ